MPINFGKEEEEISYQNILNEAKNVSSFEQLRKEAEEKEASKKGFFQRAGEGFVSPIRSAVDSLNQFSYERTGNRNWLQNFDEASDYWNAWEGAQSALSGEKNVQGKTFSRELLSSELEFASNTIKVAASPVAGILNGVFGPTGTESQEELENSTFQKLGTFIGEAEKGLGEWVQDKTPYIDLSEKEQAQLGETFIEGAMIGATPGVIKAGKLGVSGVVKGSKAGLNTIGKKIGDIKISKAEIADAFSIEIATKKKELFSKLGTDIDVAPKFEEFINELGNGRLSNKDINTFADTLGMKADSFKKTLKDITNEKFYTNKIYGEYFGKITKDFNVSNANKIRKKLQDYGYGLKATKKAKGAAIAKAKNDFGKEAVENTIKYIEAEDTSFKYKKDLLVNIAEWNTAKNQGVGYKDGRGLNIKGEDIKTAVDLGLVERNVGKGKKSYLDSFTFTQEAREIIRGELQNHSLFKEKYPKWSEIGFTEYPTKRYDGISKKIDNNKFITGDELKEMVADFNRDKSVIDLDEAIIDYKAGILKDGDELLGLFKDASDRLGLKFDEDIARITRGKDIRSLIDKYIKLRNDDFITPSKIKNIGSTLNLKQKTSYTKRVFSSLYEATDKLSNTDLTKKLKADKEIARLKTRILTVSAKLTKKTQVDTQKIKATLISLRRQMRMRENIIKAKHQNIQDFKGDMIKELEFEVKKLIPNKRIQKEVLNKITNKTKSKQWLKEESAPGIEKMFNTIHKEIEVSYTKSLIKEIKDEFKKVGVIKGIDYKKSHNIEIAYVIQLEKAQKVFDRVKYGDLDIGDLEKVHSDLLRLKQEGKKVLDIKLRQEKIEIDADIKEITPDIQNIKGTYNYDDGDFLGKIGGWVHGFDNTTLFGNRLMDKFFNFNKKAKEIFYYNIKASQDKYDLFKAKWMDRTLQSTEEIFNKSYERRMEFGEIMFARRKTYTDDGIRYDGLERQIYDPDPDSLFNQKLEVPIEGKPPKIIENIPRVSDDLINWDEIRKTKLGEVLMKSSDADIIKAMKIWDNFYDILGQLVKKTGKDIDNIDVNIDKEYFPFVVKDAVYDIDLSVGSNGGDFAKQHISKGALKRIKDIKNEGVTYEKDPYKALYGHSNTSAYYAFMQGSLKKAQKTYNGVSEPLKDLNIGELENLKKNGYNLLYKDEKIDVDFNDITREGVLYRTIDSEGNLGEPLRVAPERIHAVDTNIVGLNKSMNKEVQTRMERYLQRVARGGNMNKSTTDRLIARAANHYNSLPLLYNISSALKQPLSILDATGVIGASHVGHSLRDIMKDPELSKLLDDVPAIRNRQGGLYLIREALNTTPKGGKAEIAANMYGKFKEAGFSGLRVLDQFTYKRIWLAGYRRILEEQGYLKSGEPLTHKHFKEGITSDNMDSFIAQADEWADKVTSTANPLVMPQAYDNVWNKAFFGLFTNQLSRLQNIMKENPILYKDGKYTEMAALNTSFLMANYMDYLVGMTIGKTLYSLGLESWEGYDKDMADIMLSTEALQHSTIEQFWVASKFQGFVDSGGPAPILTGLGKTFTDADNIKKDILGDRDKIFEDISKFIADTFTGKAGKYLHNSIFQ